MACSTRTYYDILEVKNDASDLDIRKAYRRLALQFHPDRNNGSTESTEKFKEIGEAYSCLSNPTSRRDYDAVLREEPSTTTTQPSQQQSHYYPHGSTKVSPFPVGGSRRWTRNAENFDAFRQFDFLFREDPFFHSAFRDMDEEFARRFQQGQPLSTDNSDNKNANSCTMEQDATSSIHERPREGSKGKSNSKISKNKKVKSKEGWIPWLLRQCGVEFHMTSYSSNAFGGTTTTQYSSNSRSSYTQKQSRVFRDRQGRLVTIQSMEQNGNQIEDTLINNRLVQRRVNGIVEPLERIHWTQA